MGTLPAAAAPACARCVLCKPRELPSRARLQLLQRLAPPCLRPPLLPPQRGHDVPKPSHQAAVGMSQRVQQARVTGSQ